MTGLTLTLKLRKFETIDKYVADCFLTTPSILLLSFVMDRKVFWIFGSLYYFVVLCQFREYSSAKPKWTHFERGFVRTTSENWCDKR